MYCASKINSDLSMFESFVLVIKKHLQILSPQHQIYKIFSQSLEPIVEPIVSLSRSEQFPEYKTFKFLRICKLNAK